MDTDLERRVAAELRAELARQGHSRHWLADQTGIPVTTIARWLRGPQSPRLNELDAMTQALGLTVSELLEAAGRQSPALLRAAGMGAPGGIRTPKPSDPWVDSSPFRVPAPRRRRSDRTGVIFLAEHTHRQDAA